MILLARHSEVIESGAVHKNYLISESSLANMPHAEKVELVRKHQTPLYRHTVAGNVKAVRFLIAAGASVTSWSLNAAFVPEQPLYFLAGKGALHIDLDKKEIFVSLLDIAIEENESLVPTDKWAIGTCDLSFTISTWTFPSNIEEPQKEENGREHSGESNGINNAPLLIDKRLRRWSIMHEAAFHGQIELLILLLEVSERAWCLTTSTGDGNQSTLNKILEITQYYMQLCFTVWILL